MGEMIDDMILREDAQDEDAALFVFGKGRARRAFRATTAEYAWKALQSSLSRYDTTDDWYLLTVDGKRT